MTYAHGSRCKVGRAAGNGEDADPQRAAGAEKGDGLMAAHEQYADDLALYAVGSLPASEAAGLEQHLETCSDCRRELEALRGDAALLALSSAGPAAPARSRARLLNALATEPYAHTVRRRRPFFELVPILAAAALVLISILLWRENVQMRRRYEYLQAHQREEGVRLAKAQELIEMLTAPSVQRVSLNSTNLSPQPHAKCMYKAQNGHLLLMASNLAQLPSGKTYQLWIFPKKTNQKPVPAGMFKPDADGNAMVLNPSIPTGVEARGFAVTIEPEG